MVRALIASDETAAAEAEDDPGPAAGPPPAKRGRPDKYADFRDADAEERSVHDEVQCYLAEPLAAYDPRKPLSWWSRQVSTEHKHYAPPA